ncbi:MAG: LysR family transcriptional regulator [Clostridiales bacterium]|nr:LysR family transcriptional regulator [Clostridiales bacterium]
MDIRVLRYFLTVAREESFSRAADALYLSQPTLSRQIKDMEEELGVQLLVRTNRNVRLTQEGQRLRRRAQEIVDLVDKTQEEFSSPEGEVAGEIAIGCGETQIMREVARVAIPLQHEHPGIRFNLYSANADDVSEKLDQGLLDFGLMFDPFDMRKYDTLMLPFFDTIGFLMKDNHPLAKKKSIRMEDVTGIPLIIPRQGHAISSSASIMNRDFDLSRLNVVCYYNLLFNAAVMVEQGMGIAFCLDHLAEKTEHTGLTFRPVYPPMVNRLRLAWKKYQIFSPAAELFLRRMKQEFGSETLPANESETVYK